MLKLFRNLFTLSGFHILETMKPSSPFEKNTEKGPEQSSVQSPVKNPEEHLDPAWDILLHARSTPPSSEFLQNVLQEVSQTPQTHEEHLQPAAISRFPAIFRMRRVLYPIVASAAAVALLLALPLFSPSNISTPPRIAHNSTPSTDLDMELIVHLDELIAYEENSLWVDSSYSF